MSLFGADEHYISGHQGTLGAVIKEKRFIAMHRLTAVPCGHVWLLVLPINHLSHCSHSQVGSGGLGSGALRYSHPRPLRNIQEH